MTGLMMLLSISMAVLGFIGAVIMGVRLGRLNKLVTAVLVAIAVVGIIGSLILVIGVPAGQLHYAPYVVKYEAAKTTMKRVPFIDGKIDLRMAAVAIRLIEINQDLAEIKYWDSWAWGVFDWFYPDEVVKLEFLSFNGQEKVMYITKRKYR